MYADPTTVRSTTILLPYTGAYDWAAAVRFFAARAVDGVEQVDGELYRRTIRVGDATGVLEVGHEPSKHALQATLQVARHGGRPGGYDAAAANVRPGRRFNQDQRRPRERGPDGAARGGATGPARVRRLGPLRGRDAHHQRAAGIGRAGASSQRRACGALRRSLSGHRDRFTAFSPTPSEVLEADLAGMGMPGARVAALKTMAEAAVSDAELFTPGHSLDATLGRLRAIKGIGEWTAHYIAMRACRQPDAFPASDVGLLRGAAGEDGVRPTPAALLARAEAWRPWRAYAAHHLWNVDSAASSGVRTHVDAATVGA